MASRGQQFKGGGDSPDVSCPSLPGIHFEVKRTEAISIYRAMEQAAHDAGRGVMPTVVHRRNGEEWLVVMRAADWIKFARHHLTDEAKEIAELIG